MSRYIVALLTAVLIATVLMASVAEARIIQPYHPKKCCGGEEVRQTLLNNFFNRLDSAVYKALRQINIQKAVVLDQTVNLYEASKKDCCELKNVIKSADGWTKAYFAYIDYVLKKLDEELNDLVIHLEDKLHHCPCCQIEKLIKVALDKIKKIIADTKFKIKVLLHNALQQLAHIEQWALKHCNFCLFQDQLTKLLDYVTCQIQKIVLDEVRQIKCVIIQLEHQIKIAQKCLPPNCRDCLPKCVEKIPPPCCSTIPKPCDAKPPLPCPRPCIPPMQPYPCHPCDQWNDPYDPCHDCHCCKDCCDSCKSEPHHGCSSCQHHGEPDPWYPSVAEIEAEADADAAAVADGGADDGYLQSQW